MVLKFENNFIYMYLFPIIFCVHYCFSPVFLPFLGCYAFSLVSHIFLLFLLLKFIIIFFILLIDILLAVIYIYCPRSRIIFNETFLLPVSFWLTLPIVFPSFYNSWILSSFDFSWCASSSSYFQSCL